MSTTKKAAPAPVAKESGHDRATGRAASAAAGERLRLAHRDEYEGYLKEERESRGLTYVRALTPEERAERDRLRRIEKAKAAQAALLEQYPELLSENVAGTAAAMVEEAGA